MLTHPPFAPDGCPHCHGASFWPSEPGAWSCTACGHVVEAPDVKMPEWTLQGIEFWAATAPKPGRPAAHHSTKHLKPGICAASGHHAKRLFRAAPPEGGSAVSVCAYHEAQWARLRGDEWLVEC